MPSHVTEITMTGSLCMMDHTYRRTSNDAFSRSPETSAHIDIFVVKKKSFVEAFQCDKVSSAKQHEHAGDPLRKQPCPPWRDRITPVGKTQNFSQQSTGRREKTY